MLLYNFSRGENKTECPASSDEWNLYPGKKTFRKNVYCLKNKYYITYQITEFLYIYKRDTSNSLFCNLIIKTGMRWERIPLFVRFSRSLIVVYPTACLSYRKEAHQAVNRIILFLISRWLAPSSLSYRKGEFQTMTPVVNTSLHKIKVLLVLQSG